MTKRAVNQPTQNWALVLFNASLVYILHKVPKEEKKEKKKEDGPVKLKLLIAPLRCPSGAGQI